MSSYPGLPTQGCNVTIVITKVDSYPLCPLIEFWGNFGQAMARDYQSLAQNIQSPENLFQEFEGNSGDLCLVQIEGTWYRSRIVRRNGSNCQVLLIDKGITCSTTTKSLAWGKREHFQLSPEVELCVLANVWPHSPENRWSPFAFEFTQTLRGKTVKAHVQDVIVNPRKLVLDIPYITRQMYEMGLAKKLEPSIFLDFVLSPESKTEAEKFYQTSMSKVEQLHKEDLYMGPKLSAGAVERVVVTEVTNPQRIFCQLKVFSEELKELSEKITQCCQGRMVSCSVDPEMIGFPCAARGDDGNWYRSVLQQVFPVSQLVEVLNVDYGTKQLVQMENLRPLALEFFKMPVVTYVCSLHGIMDKGVGWTTTQITYLKSLLLHKTLIAKFRYKSISEGVYYVTLYGDENTDLNNVFCSKQNSLLKSEETPCDDAFGNVAYSSHNPPQLQINEGIMLPSEQTMLVEAKVERIKMFPDENIFPGSSHVARVSHVISPAEFWIQTQEAVHERNIRTLPDGFEKRPQLALKCSLAGLRPKDLTWSRSAIEFFSKIITDKLLNVHVMETYSGSYVVTLTDPESQGEKDIGKMLCSSGLAECNEIKKKSQISTENSETRILDVNGSSEVSSQTQNNVDPSSKELQFGKFEENMFPVGSILDVNVSYIESPNNFWCQLAQNFLKLKLLMHDIQAHYADSIYEPLTEAACVVRHPDNGLWYRGLVIGKHETTHVTVLFVDYGHTKTVSLHDLRNIGREFLNLHGQAFRCSLYNPLEVMSVVNDWNENGKEKFLNFVKTAASNFVPLKCTVYAIKYNKEKLVLNIVDLETPFESICTIMAKLDLFTPARTVLEPSYHLDTYYYSTHSIKIGTEEQVTVTCVNGVSQFYCQLERNANELKNLNNKVNDLCRQLGNTKPPTLFQKLCFAKYTDGLWYRAQIKATQPSILVFFVDYGDTAEVDKSNLLPVPKEANDIMSVPVQAVMCCLSDVPIDVPSEVNNWFQKSVTECKFQALVVAKEPNGSLLVELYHKNTQINSKIKKNFQLQVQTEGQDLYQRRKTLENANREQEASVSAQVSPKNNALDPKPGHQATQPSRWNLTNEKKVKIPSQELYQTPQQRQHQSKQICKTERKENLTVTNDSEMHSKSPDKEFGNVLPQANYPKLPKIEDLPKNGITLAMEADVYVSHFNSPSSFYVQLVREEDDIVSLVDKLNDPLSTPKISITKVDAGDLVEAEFPDDSSWYRAGVKEVLLSSTALVEFVDFGNTARLPFSKLAKLNQDFVQLPRYSTHCALSEADSLEPLDSEVMSTLKREIGSNAEKILKCRFVQQLEEMWQVTLEDNGVQVTCKAAAPCPRIPSDNEDNMEKSMQNSETSLNFSSLSYHHLEFTEGQQLDVYISAFCEAHTFWCQPADSVALDNITESLSEIGNAAYNTRVNMSALSPGTPCIAFFAEEQVWCRAEVLAEEGEELTVLFVDYGNSAKVASTEVREIPPDLLETHLQAFLCELDGFDESHGSWCDGACNELASITENKLLQMTVTKTSSEDGKNMYFVQLDCEGQGLNETMKSWWMTSTLENKPDVGETENEPPESVNARLAVPGAHAGIDHNDADLYCAVTSTPKGIHIPLDCLHTSIISTETPPEERPLSESETSEGENTVLTVLIPCMKTNVSQIDSGIQENVFPLQNMEKNIVESGQDFDEEAASVVDTCLSDEIKAPPGKTIQEATDESGIPLSPFEVVDSHNMSHCAIVGTYSADPNVSTDDKVANSNPVMSGTNVKMVLHDAVMNYVVPHDTAVDTSEGSELVPSESVPPSLVPVVQLLHDAPEEQNESEDVIPQHEDIHVKEMNDVTTEDNTSALFEVNAYSDLPPDPESQLHIGTFSSPDVGAVAEKVMQSVKALTDPNEQSDGETAARNQCRISMSGEEMELNQSLLPIEPVIESSSEQSEERETTPQDESNTVAEDALSFDTEAGFHTPLSPDEDDVEAVTCLVRDLHLTETLEQEYEAAVHD